MVIYELHHGSSYTCLMNIKTMTFLKVLFLETRWFVMQKWNVLKWLQENKTCFVRMQVVC